MVIQAAEAEVAGEVVVVEPGRQRPRRKRRRRKKRRRLTWAGEWICSAEVSIGVVKWYAVNSPVVVVVIPACMK